MVKKHIPNAITCMNVVCGSIAVVLAVRGMLTPAVICIILAAVFDFFDGMAARLLKSYSPMGKELDSLADMVSFGLVPGILMFSLLDHSLGETSLLQGTFSIKTVLYTIPALFIPVFSALRLAKFNIDERQTSSFIGLPTPANALFISSLALISEHGSHPQFDSLLFHPLTLGVISIAFSFLLVLEIPMFALKFKNLSLKDNKVRYIFLSCALLLIALLGIYGIAATIVFFILLSIFTQESSGRFSH